MDVSWANRLDPDQLAHSCHLILIYTVRFLVRNNRMNLKANIVGSDQTAWMSWLIRTYYGEKHKETSFH
jgi:hypothetical protein